MREPNPITRVPAGPPATVENHSGYLALLKYVAYVDESGHSKDPRRDFVSLAGLLAKATAWEQLEPEWSAACLEHGLAEPFHMKDLAAFQGPFKAWTEKKRRTLLTSLMASIRKAEAIPIGSVVSVPDFNALDERRKSRFRDPYFVAFQPLTFNLAVAASFAFPPGRVTMVYAHHPEYSDGLANARDLWQAVRRANPIVSVSMEAYQSGTPQNCIPLQAADLWAYELGHHFEVIRPGKKKPRWPFQQFVKMGLNYSFAHDFITFRDAQGIHGLGLMSRVQQWHEIALYEPGYVDRNPFHLLQAARRIPAARG
jgi:hypothetical protein